MADQQETYTNTILITGGTSGLGYYCASDLAASHPTHQVIVASRNDADSAAESINKSLEQRNVLYLPLDLSSQEKIRSFVTDYKKRSFPPLSVLVLNAGIQIVRGVTKTVDGIETTFGVNHVGHVLLFELLRPCLTETARIVVTASGVHDPLQKTGMPAPTYVTAEALAHPSEEQKNQTAGEGRRRYAQSKLCNVLWMYALHKRLEAAKSKITVMAMDPGLARDASAPLRWAFVHVLPHLVPLLRLAVANIHTIQDSAAALARLATGEDVAGVSGVYYEGRKPISSSTDSYVVEKQEDLWNWTLKHLAKDEAELQAFETF